MAQKNLKDAGSFLIFLIGILVFFSLATHTSTPVPETNLIGRVGMYSSSFLYYLFGRTAFLIPICLLYMGGFALYRGELVEPLLRMTSMFVLSVTAAIWIGLITELASTGWIGETLGGMLSFAFGRWGGFIVSFGIFVPAFLLSTGTSAQEAGQMIAKLYAKVENGGKTEGEAAAGSHSAHSGDSGSVSGGPMPGRPADTGAGTVDKSGRMGMLLGAAGLAYAWLNQKKKADASEDDVKFFKREFLGSRPFFERVEEAEESRPAGTARIPAASDDLAHNARRPRPAADTLAQPASPHGILRSASVEAAPSQTPSYNSRYVKETGSYEGQFTADQSRFFFRRPSSAPQTAGAWVQNLPTPSSVMAARLQASRESARVEQVTTGIALAERIQDEPIAPVFDLSESKELAGEANREPSLPSRTMVPAEAGWEEQDQEEDQDQGAGEQSDSDEDAFEDLNEETPGLADAATRAAAVKMDAPFEEEEPQQPDLPLAKEYPPTAVPAIRRRGGRYSLATDILSFSPAIPVQDAEREVAETTEKIEKVLRDFSIPGRVVRTQRGPIVTLFEILLDSGVRLSKILGIESEIRMHLAVPSVRIVAPLPGKPTVGLEIPNRVRQTVTLGDIARRDREFFDKKRLGIVLGKDIAGKNLFLDITRAPHLLIAGASGQGKSVYLNSVIASLLYKYSPEEVRFIMIDPKMVELKLFEGIPHLLTPVITDPRQAARALAWSIQEMEYRYAHLSRAKSREFLSYNARMQAEGKERMPFIVIVIDELSDLMLVSPKETEDALWRIAQKARAVGIHMIMATQRPSVDVITPHIKANAGARVAFHVSQKTDSRIILDHSGADALLGGGDMLYRSPDSPALTRVQAPLITEEEIASIVAETRKYGEAVFIELGADEEEETVVDDGMIDPELLEQAWKIILESGKPTTSYVQRRLRIGYNRAANIIETLEQRGYLGPAMGSSRMREILRKEP